MGVDSVGLSDGDFHEFSDPFFYCSGVVGVLFELEFEDVELLGDLLLGGFGVQVDEDGVDLGEEGVELGGRGGEGGGGGGEGGEWAARGEVGVQLGEQVLGVLQTLFEVGEAD